MDGSIEQFLFADPLMAAGAGEVGMLLQLSARHLAWDRLDSQEMVRCLTYPLHNLFTWLAGILHSLGLVKGFLCEGKFPKIFLHFIRKSCKVPNDPDLEFTKDQHHILQVNPY